MEYLYTIIGFIGILFFRINIFFLLAKMSVYFFSWPLPNSFYRKIGSVHPTLMIFHKTQLNCTPFTFQQNILKLYLLYLKLNRNEKHNYFPTFIYDNLYFYAFSLEN